MWNKFLPLKELERNAGWSINLVIVFSPRARLIDPQTQVTRLGVSSNNVSFQIKGRGRSVESSEADSRAFFAAFTVPAGRGVPVRRAPGKHPADGIRGGGQGVERRRRGRGAHLQRLCVREQH